MASKSIIIGTFVLVVLLGVFGGGVATGILVGGNDNADLENATNIPVGDEDEEETEVATEAVDNSEQEEEDNEPARSISPRKFNSGNITEYIIKYINVARVNGSANVTTDSMNIEANLTGGGGLEPLQTETTNADRLTNMAESHSDAMAREGRVSHTVNNITTVNRYEQYGLYQRCEINVDNNYVLRPDSDQFEVIGLTVAGQEYTPNDNVAGWEINTTANQTTDEPRIQFNANDKQVARALVIHWLDGADKSHPILFDEAEEVGVGVSLTTTGNVYATVNICGS
jgi:hypothetical protein